MSAGDISKKNEKWMSYKFFVFIFREETALFVAARYGHSAVAKCLLDAKAEVNARDKW